MSHSPETFQQLGKGHTYLRNFDTLGILIGQGRSFSGRERNCLFLNTRDNRFTEVAAATGFDYLDDGRAAGTTDWDRDGDLDIWLNNRTGPRVRFLKNNFQRSQNTHYVAFRLEGGPTNRDAIGARIEVAYQVESEERTAIKTLRAGDGFLSQSSKGLHFGLGNATSIDRVTVRWPRVNGMAASESIQVLNDLELDRRYSITQQRSFSSGRPAHSIETTPATTSTTHNTNLDGTPTSDSGSNQDGFRNSTPSQRVFLTRRKPLPNIDYIDGDGNQQHLTVTPQEGLFITFWASWCDQCVQELDELSNAHSQLASAGISCLALCADQLADDRQSVASPQRDPAGQDRRQLKQLKWPFAYGTLNRKAASDVLGVYHRTIYRQHPLTLPFSVLVDRRGEIAAFYRGRVALGRLLEDASALTAGPEQIAAAAFPFAGGIATTHFQRDPLAQAVAQIEAGLLPQARGTLEDTIRRSKGNRSLRLLNAYRMLANVASHEGRTDDAIDVIRTAIQILPQQLGLRIQYAKLIADSGDAAAASRELEAILKTARDNWQRLNQLGLAFEYVGDSHRAVAAYSAALRIKPDAYQVRANRAAALLAAGDTDKALAEFRQLRKVRPDSMDIANNLAWILATATNKQLRDASEALRLAKSVVARDGGQHPATLDTLSAAHAANGDRNQAIDVARRALELAQLRGDTTLVTKLELRLQSLTP